MADKQDHPIKTNDTPRVMGDGTEEQNLGQPGDPSKRITGDEVDEAFSKNKKSD